MASFVSGSGLRVRLDENAPNGAALDGVFVREQQTTEGMDAPPVDQSAVEHEGFNLHASVVIAADDDLRRERLMRYGARPGTRATAACSPPSRPNGAAGESVLHNDTLVVDNTATAISLSNISGPGAFVQLGAAPTTLLANRRCVRGERPRRRSQRRLAFMREGNAFP